MTVDIERHRCILVAPSTSPPDARRRRSPSSKKCDAHQWRSAKAEFRLPPAKDVRFGLRLYQAAIVHDLAEPRRNPCPDAHNPCVPRPQHGPGHICLQVAYRSRRARWMISRARKRRRYLAIAGLSFLDPCDRPVGRWLSLMSISPVSGSIESHLRPATSPARSLQLAPNSTSTRRQ